MRTYRLLTALIAALALALAGCGGDDEGGGGGGGDTGAATTPAETAPETGEDTGGAQAADGKQLFTDTCGGCHVLSDAGTEGQVGPNLDDLKPDADAVKQAIEQGPSVMPENLLQGAEADAVAQYVAENAGG